MTMVPMRNLFLILSGVTVGVTAVVTWVAWKYIKRKHVHTRPLYVAKNIHIVNSPEEWETLYQQLRKDKILGLDCEWVAKQKVALLQLASPSGLCVLVRLFKLRPHFPESLRRLLADNSILKFGVAIIEDGKRLHQDYGLYVCGCVDLRHVLKRSKGTFQCASSDLRGLAEGILGVDISKNNSIRCGNWEAETYSQKQVEYAATDAAVAVDIFLSLVFTKRKELSTGDQSVKKNRSLTSEHPNIPSSPASIQDHQSSNNLADVATSEHNLLPDEINYQSEDIVEYLEDIDSLEDNEKCEPSMQVMDKNFKDDDMSVNNELYEAYLHSKYNCGDSRVFPSQMFDNLHDDKKKEIYIFAKSLCQGIVDSGYKYQANKSGTRGQSKQREKGKTNAYSFRKRPLWDNCKLQAPDGTVLCTCDFGKAQWYLDKELGDKVCEDPLTVRLRFEPTGRPESERNYYLHEKENVCVVCGLGKDYVRKFIVPGEYRTHFPRALKDHSSHDVLLLCSTCHRRSSESDIALRQEFVTECDAPLDSGITSRICMDFELQKVRSAGRALMMNKASLPEQRVVELEKLLQDFYGVAVTEELVRQAANINAKQTADNYIPHGKKVVTYYASTSGLLAFQRKWRQHFLTTMNPQHLPAFWSVDFVP